MPASRYCHRCLTTFTEDPENCTNLSCGKPRPAKGWGTLLGPGDLLDRHYKILKALAVGGAGLTYLAQEVDGSGKPQPPSLAIKVLYTARDAGPFLRRLSNEAQILQELAHEHIVECRGFVHRAGHAPYLVTLFEEGGSLSDHLERVGVLPPRVAGTVLRQILLALDVAHQRGVVHRDLKPDNVLLREKTERTEVPWVRVTDFGIAKVEWIGGGLTKIGSFVGTPEYAAPEQFEGASPAPATDVFSAGGLLYYLLVGTSPVRFSHRLDIAHSYDELLAQIPPKIPESVGPEDERAILQQVIDNVMRAEQEERWTIQQILAALNPLVQRQMAAGTARTIETTAPGAPPRVGHAGTVLTHDSITYQEATPAVSRGTVQTTPAPDPIPTEMAEPEPPKRTQPRSQSKPTPPLPPVAVERDVVDEIESPYPAPAPRRRGGGLLGMGAVAMLALVGSVVSVVTLAGAALAFGWFAAAPDAPDTTVSERTAPVVVVARTEPVELTGATDPARVADRRAITSGLEGAKTDLRILCGVRGEVGVELVVEADGRVRSALVDPRTVKASADAGCLEAAISKLSMPRTLDEPARARISVTLR